MIRVIPSLFIVALFACTSAHGPSTSTQTGNPPVLDLRRIMLEVSNSEVHIVGEPGAVKPGGTKIEIENLSTGEVVVVTAADDGSFDARVGGSLDDEFEVRAINQHGHSEPVHVTRGGAIVGPRDGGVRPMIDAGSDASAQACADRAAASSAPSALAWETLRTADTSCQVATDCALVSERRACVLECGPPMAVTKAVQAAYHAELEAIRDDLCSGFPDDGCAPGVSCSLLIAYPSEAHCASGTCAVLPLAPDCTTGNRIAGEIVEQILVHADNSCTSDDDCVKYDPSNVCYQACGPGAVSRAAKAEVEAANERIDIGLCSAFESDGCVAPSLPCQPLAPFTPSCSNGTCEAKTIECDACLTENIAWGRVANLNVGDESRVEGCRSYSRRRDSTMGPGVEPVTCQGELSACESDGFSTVPLLFALADEDVRVALSQGAAVFGDIGPVDYQPLFITVGSASIQLRYPCEPEQMDCARTPRGVQALADLLKAIDDSMATTQCPQFAGL
jgi:hypothetical protein